MSVNATAVRTTRRLAAAIAVVVVFDAVWVGAPFLVFMAVPFAVVAWRYRGRRVVSDVAVLVACAGYTVMGVTYMLTNGFDAPEEAGQAREAIGAGDFAAVYIGTPLAVWLAVRTVRSLGARRRNRTTAAIA
jgi:hypothetical protein